MGKVIAVCTSDRRGIQKHDVNSGYFEVNWGIDGDAHAGSWHRQVSLLSADKIAAFNEKGAGVIPGAFGENLVVDGFDFRTLPVGTLLAVGDVGGTLLTALKLLGGSGLLAYIIAAIIMPDRPY